MTTGHFPSVAAATDRATSRPSSPRLFGAAATLFSLALVTGCALTPAAAGPVVTPSAAATSSATAVATTRATPSTTASTTPSASPSPTATKPPDPLAALSAKARKKFKPCLSRGVGPGSSGTCTTLLLKELRSAGYYNSSATRFVGVAGANAILNYQRSRGIQATGYAYKKTWTALATKAPVVASEVPKTCLTKGVVLCVDQSRRTLTWRRSGKVVKTFKVRLGGYAQHAKTHIWRNFPTANGTWRVFSKQVNPVSENYGAGAMPYSTMFHPDMYVHYSPGFNRQGYSQSSHGCVNIRKLGDAIWIFRNTPIGAKVHVYSPKATT